MSDTNYTVQEIESTPLVSQIKKISRRRRLYNKSKEIARKHKITLSVIFFLLLSVIVFVYKYKNAKVEKSTQKKDLKKILIETAKFMGLLIVVLLVLGIFVSVMFSMDPFSFAFVGGQIIQLFVNLIGGIISSM